MTEERQDCEKALEMMGLLVSADVSLPGLPEAREHVSRCRSCQNALKRMQDEDRKLRQFADSHHERISDLRRQTLNALPSDPVAAKVQGRGRTWISAGALAAVLVFLLIFLKGPDASFHAWAEVLETVRRATTSQFRLKDLSGGNVEARQTYSVDGTAHRTFENGKLVEALFVDFRTAEMVYLGYPLELAARMNLSEDMVQDFHEHDPAETFNFLQEYEFEELGTRRIDGKKAVGIRISDARFMAEHLEHAELELWVDPATKLPIRFDVQGEVAGGERFKKVRFHDFRWNEPLPQNEFRPEIPAGFNLHDGIDLVVDEAHCLASLRLFSGLVGRYPSTLAYESLKTELWASKGARQRDVGDMVVDMFRIRVASTFYGQLMSDDLEVVYFGNSIRPDESHRVLMRWKTGTDQYRVVFGDLKVATVSGADLLKMEGQ